MEIISPQIIYTRSCSGCQSFVDFDKPVETYHVFCCYDCKFKFIGFIINRYEDSEIKTVMILKVPGFKNIKFDRTKWKFQLNKILVEEML